MEDPKTNLQTRSLRRNSTDHAFLPQRLRKVRKSKILTSTTFVCVAAFLVSSSFLLAKPKKSITDICNEKARNAYDKCVGAGSSAVLCADISNKTFSNCLIRLGYFGNASGPATNGSLQPPGTSPSPSGVKPIHPISQPVTSKGPVLSPTPTPQHGPKAHHG